MTLNYPVYMPAQLRYEYCPMCTSKLVEEPGRDGQMHPNCHVCHWTYYPANLLGVTVVIRTSEGVVFLMQQGESADATATLPSGGVEFGETPEEAATRLAREQTGLVVEIRQDLGRYFDRDFPLGPLLSFMFEARAVGGKLRSGTDARAAVFAEEQFPSISTARKGSQRALAAYSEAKRSYNG